MEENKTTEKEFPNFQLKRNFGENEKNKYYDLIQSIHKKKAPIHNPIQNDKLCKAVMEIAFEGGFSGGGVYLTWSCGSWLNSDISELFSISKDFGKGISFYEEEMGKDKTFEEWKNYYESYLIMPNHNYKTKEKNLSGLPNHTYAKQAWTILNSAWRRKTLNHNFQFINFQPDHGLDSNSLDERIEKEIKHLKALNSINDLFQKFIRIEDFHSNIKSVVIEKLFPLPFNYYNLNKRKRFMTQFKKQLNELHEKGFVHGELKRVGVSAPDCYFNIAQTKKGIRLNDSEFTKNKLFHLSEEELIEAKKRELNELNDFENYYLSLESLKDRHYWNSKRKSRV